MGDLRQGKAEGTVQAVSRVSGLLCPPLTSFLLREPGGLLGGLRKGEGLAGIIPSMMPLTSEAQRGQVTFTATR